MKKILIIVVFLGLSGLIGYTLYANMQEIEENAKLAEVTSDAIPVEVAGIEAKSLGDKVSADGTFQAQTDLTILSETQGKIIRVYKEKGTYVRKGELLAQVENDLLKAEVAAVEANYEKLQADLKRFTRLSESDAITERQLEEVKIGVKNAEAQLAAAQKRLDNTSIRATASGIINDDFVQEGAFIGGGARLYEIVDINTLKLNVKLTANEILKVKTGDKITVTSPIFPEDKFTATVTAIAAKADAALKYSVELEMKNPKGTSLKPGMYATAHFDFENAGEKNYLSRNALVGSVQNPQVFVVSNGLATLKNITVGEVRNDWIEVVGGLNSTDQIVVNGQINLTEGTKVKILNL